jgi:hypothetical protein
MADRQSYQFTTPTGTTVELRSYLTGREFADIKGILLSSLTMSLADLESKKVNTGGMSGDVIMQQERKTLDYLVVSVNGEPENAVEKLLDLPSTELEAVLKEIEKIKNPTKPAN